MISNSLDAISSGNMSLEDMSLADILNELAERYHVSPYQLCEAAAERKQIPQDRLGLLMREAAQRLRPLGRAA